MQRPEHTRTARRRDFLILHAGAGALLSLGGSAFGAEDAARVLQVAAITEVFGDGIRLTGAAIEYDRPVRSAALHAADFQVRGRTVTGVATGSSADPATRAPAGRFVIVSLDPQDAAAVLTVRAQPQRPSGPSSQAAQGPGPVGGPPRGGSDTSYRAAQVVVERAGPGALAAPVASTHVRNLVVDDFQQAVFQDPKTGDSLRYNLFLPQDHDPAKTYPLVLFMHDAGATSEIARTTLMQGLGAIAWASPGDQAHRPCVVLAPQYADLIADDNSQTTSMLDTTIDLVKSLVASHGADPRRLYATGQSGGCMMAIAMNIRYPGFFAASFLVAGQWDPALVKPMARQKLWILVSQDDAKAYPGQNAITAVLAQQGARISRATWDGTWTAPQFQAAFDRIAAEGSPINYVSFAKGTVIPPGEWSAGASGHRNTWRIAYSIEPIRQWIFQRQGPA